MESYIRHYGNELPTCLSASKTQNNQKTRLHFFLLCFISIIRDQESILNSNLSNKLLTREQREIDCQTDLWTLELIPWNAIKLTLYPQNIHYTFPTSTKGGWTLQSRADSLQGHSAQRERGSVFFDYQVNLNWARILSVVSLHNFYRGLLATLTSLLLRAT